MDGQPDLLTWARANYPKDTKRTDWFKERIAFIIDEIPLLISNSIDQENTIRKEIKVIYERTTELENVPEVMIKHPNGLEIVLLWTVEENVWESEWFVSINSPKQITANLHDILITGEGFRPGLFGGLPFKMTRYPTYVRKDRNFVFGCRNTYRLHTIIWLIGQNLSLRKN